MSDRCPLGSLTTSPWLSTMWEPGLSQSQKAIAAAFLELVEASLSGEHPDKTLICFDGSDTGLRIRVGSSAGTPSVTESTLRGLADQVEALARLGAPQDHPADAEGISTTANPPRVDSSSLPDPFDLVDAGLPSIAERESEAEIGGATRSTEMYVPIFSGPTPRQLLRTIVGQDAETSKRLEAIMRRLMVLGTTRPLRFPIVDWRARVDRLIDEFPNFAAVIKMVVIPHLSMFSGNCPHRMTPVLLIGQPGIGKTQFARELQHILAVPAQFLSMASETNGSSLAGSSTFWSNSSPGKLFEQIAWGTSEFEQCGVANSLVIVDEVDKCDGVRYDPLGSLYTLLEQESARRFEDQSVPGLLLDMSHIRFVLTANDERSIPAPLLSRVSTFHIDMPSATQVQAIAQRIYESLLDRYQLGLERRLPALILDEVSGLSPRHLKIRLEAALAVAVSDGKKSLDLESWWQTNIKSGTAKPRMGFV